MPSIPVLNRDEIRLLRDMLSKLRNQRQNSVNDYQPGIIHQSNDVYMVQVPCGETIPAISGDIPGHAECCLFRMELTSDIQEPDSYRIVPVYLPDGKSQKTIRVYNIHNIAAASGTYWEVYKEKFSRWLVEKPIQTSAGGSIVSSTVTTTTTTSDSFTETQCTGEGKWIWDDTNERWNLDTENCAAKVTTSTTTTTTTTASCVYDTFEDDDETEIGSHISDSGDSWTTLFGSPVILGNELQMNPSDSLEQTEIDTQRASGIWEVYVRPSTGWTATDWTVALDWRVIDANNFFYVEVSFNGVNYVYSAYQVTSGVNTLLYNQNINLSHGETFLLKVKHHGASLTLHVPDSTLERIVNLNTDDTSGHSTGDKSRLLADSTAGLFEVYFADFQSYAQVQCLEGTDCLCVIPTTTTTTSDLTSTTTTTTTTQPPVDCEPAYPSYCGSTDGECTYTECVSGYTDNSDCPRDNQAGTTTTTPDVSSCDCDTTTTPADLSPGCKEGCEWFTGPGIHWVKTKDGCSPDCPCSYPPDNEAGQDCTEWWTSCQPNPPPTTPNPYCKGECFWICNDNNEWIYSDSDCEWSGVVSCACVKPVIDCGCAERLITLCADLSPSSTTSTTTTTEDVCAVYCAGSSTTSTTTTTSSIPGTCETGSCIYKSNEAGDDWIIEVEDCGDCECSPPPNADPKDTCETKKVGCGGDTTTTSTTTTSTTTNTTSTQNCCDQLADIEVGGWCEDTNVVFNKNFDYQWTANETLSCGDAFSATVTCHPNNPDSSGIVGDCDTRFTVSVSWPCATGFNWNISSCSCDSLPDISFTTTGGSCNCCGGAAVTTTTAAPATTTTAAPVTTSTTTTTTTTSASSTSTSPA